LFVLLLFVSTEYCKLKYYYNAIRVVKAGESQPRAP
jgi:hypothetical protein